jgi:predicted RNA-binding protein with PUA-like domain
VGPIKLKGVDLPTFDGEDKVEYEQWKAAFTSAVDYADIPVNKKMLRLQNSLKGKALKLVNRMSIQKMLRKRFRCTPRGTT